MKMNMWEKRHIRIWNLDLFRVKRILIVLWVIQAEDKIRTNNLVIELKARLVSKVLLSKV